MLFLPIMSDYTNSSNVTNEAVSESNNGYSSDAHLVTPRSDRDVSLLTLVGMDNDSVDV